MGVAGSITFTITCYRCGSVAACVRTTKLNKQPESFLITLKRFMNSGTKIDTDIDFTDDLRVSIFSFYGYSNTFVCLHCIASYQC